jgi:hypothetical protein
MPVTLTQINAMSTAVLTAAEKRMVRTVLREESTVAVPTEAEILAAVTSLDEDADTSGRQELRAHFAGYKSGQALIDGGADAVTLDPTIVRWGVRNGVRLLLGFSAEPRPATADSLQLISLPLTSYCSGGEYS